MEQWTVLFLVRGKENKVEVCLAKKKKKIGIDCYNGYGGKVKKGENPKAASARELWEEAEVSVYQENIKEAGEIRWCTREGRLAGLCHIHRVTFWIGVPKETEEMGEPQWFSPDNLPTPLVHPNDAEWIPQVTRGEYVLVEYHV
jgi:NADH pyrophosphatase NudC (nudix superfamily)